LFEASVGSRTVGQVIFSTILWMQLKMVLSPLSQQGFGVLLVQAGRQAGRQAGSVLKGESYGYRTAHHHQQFNKLVQHQNNEVDVLQKRKLPRNILISSKKNEKDVFSVCWYVLFLTQFMHFYQCNVWNFSMPTVRFHCVIQKRSI
jgi:hypothetical protein